MDFYNTGLIQDEVLLSNVLVLEHGATAGPTFLHALSTLIEAIIIHDRVYFDPAHLLAEIVNQQSVQGLIKASEFVQKLIDGKALAYFPEESEINKSLSELDYSYDMIDFISDYQWGLESFGSQDEKSEYEALAEIIEHVPQALTIQEFPFDAFNSRSSSLIPVDTQSLLLMLWLRNSGFSRDEIQAIETRNHRIKGFTDLTRNLGINLYPVYTALPHQISAINVSNSLAKQKYDEVVKEAIAIDQQGEFTGSTRFSYVPIPPLAQIVLSKCKGSLSAIPDEILELRHTHRDFRNYLTELERKWDSAQTRADREKINIEYENAWKKIIDKKTEPTTRWIYKLWEFVKSLNPKDFGDLVAKKGQELYVVGRVKGLNNFYHELWNSPVPKRNIQLITGLFPKVVDDEVWKTAEKLGKQVQIKLMQSQQKSDDEH